MAEIVEIPCMLNIVFDGINPNTYAGVVISYQAPCGRDFTQTWNTGDVVQDWADAMAWANDAEQGFSAVWFAADVSGFIKQAHMDLIELDGIEYPVMTPIREG